MGRHKDEQPRVLGPYFIKSEGRYRVTTLDPQGIGGTSGPSTRYFGSEEEAEDWKLIVEKRFERLQGLTFGRALDDYQAALVEGGKYTADSAAETVRRLKLFFTDHKMRLSRLTEEKAVELYRAFAASGYYVGPKKARRLKLYSVAHHQHTLKQAKTFMRWCVIMGWLKESPLERVQPIGGEPARGKEQLTGDEARKFYAWGCNKAKGGDEAALALLMLLLMALRQGDVRRRVVRDVDLDGTLLRIGVGSSARSKTKKGDRPREIPAVLQPFIKKLTDGRSPLEPLFKTPDGDFHTKTWLLAASKRLCAQAGVPLVVPHGLKGTAGTLAASSGALAHQVADFLSHESKKTSEAHYIADGAVQQAQAKRAFSVITGGRRRR